MKPQNQGYRQAVLVIHGIGEQRPMQTLRAFAQAVLGAQPAPAGADAGKAAQGPVFYSKPDRLSDTLELRRLASWPPHVAVPTDFYEVYWAHLMEGTAWSHIGAWFRVLLCRLPIGAGRRVQGLWGLAWVAVLAVAAFVLQRGAAWSTAALLSLGAAGLLAYIALRAMGWLGLHYVGDAARYLSPAPHNIAVRKNIRNAVMDLLSKLHEEEPMRYDSIIVVGHSLGSVIAYDALSHFWQRKHSALVDPQPVRQTMLGKVRRLSRLLARDDLDAPARERLLERYRARQAELLAEQRKVGVNWRIGEFVTLGSPLAHAPFMFAANTQEWAALKRERMYPTSPPQAEDDRDSGRLVQRFDFPTQARHGEVSILHHAALFACTRWTNLYFRGDWIGGPLGADALFGAGVRDVPLQPHSPWSRWTPASHVRYWHAGEPHALLELAQALRLGYPQRRSRWRLETDDSSGELRWRRAPAPAS